MYDLAIVVPARRDSSRIPNKSMLPFGDAPSLIEWKLRQLCAVIDPGRIYLSSEDDAFLAIAERLGVSRHKRELRLATGHIVPMSDVIAGVVRDIPHEHIAWCTVVCPLMPPRAYLAAFHHYHRRVIGGSHDSLLGVHSMKEYFWFRGKPLNYEADSRHISSQDLASVEKVSNSIYMAPREDILRWRYLIGGDPWLEELGKMASVDIDYPEDYRIARALYGLYVEAELAAPDVVAGVVWPEV